MTYTVETHDQIALNFTGANYSPEAWDSIVLDFAAVVFVPVLPWKKPTLIKAWGMDYQRADHKTHSLIARFEKSEQVDDDNVAQFGKGTHRALETLAPFGESLPADKQKRTRWDFAGYAQNSITAKHKEALALDDAMAAPWGDALAKDRTRYRVPFIVNTRIRDRFQSLAYFHVDITGTIYDDQAERRRLRNTDPSAMLLTLAAFDEPYTPQAWNDAALSFGWVKPSRPSVPHDTAMRLTARQATPRDGNFRLPWGAGESRWRNWNLPYPVEENEQPDPDPVDPPPIKKVYLIMNLLEVTDVDTGTPLDISNIRISLDIDSIAWKFSGDLYGDGSLALIQPDDQGMKDISVTINGHAWIFAIDRYTSDERFPTKKFRISGVSRTQYMGVPFAPALTETNAQATTAAQASNALLQNTGFSLTWPTGNDQDLPDWQIPIGALSYRGRTPAQVIGQIVSAAGGVMIPAMAADAWTIQPRYKTPPWQWDGITPDVQIYAGMVRSRAGKYEPAQEYNSVFVSGIEQGVSVDVQRQGSGGTNPMPDIFENLITDAQVAISRGRQELAQTGNKVIETLGVIIPESAATPGIILPGSIIKMLHDDSAQDYVGMVLSTNIAMAQAGGAAVYQNITIERRA